MDRRNFIRNTTLMSLGYGFFTGSESYAKDKTPAVRLGAIGCAGRGFANMMMLQGMVYALKNQTIPENLSYQAPVFDALCDVSVDDKTMENLEQSMLGRHLDVYTDYRQMLEKEHKNLDGVVISTPDVSHFAPAMLALDYGLAVWLEKPLCHNIWQIKTLQAKARQAGVITQMGNQSHSNEGIHYCKEWIDADAIGKVREVIIWTDRPFIGMQHPISLQGKYKWASPAKVPPTLDWDKWQNVATEADFRTNIVPYSWRAWWKYGSGSLGDIACHMMDIPFYCLGLSTPSKVKSRQINGNDETVPSQDMVEYQFDKSNQGVPVKMSWHSGVIPSKLQQKIANYDKSFLPKLPKAYTDLGKGYDQLSDNGQFIIGDKGVIYCPSMHLGKPVLLPKERWNDIKDKLPEHKINFPNKHYGNFINSIKGTEKPSSDFEYGGNLTEVVQLGNLSLRTNSEIIWDPKNMTCLNNKAANQFVKEEERSGWY